MDSDDTMAGREPETPEEREKFYQAVCITVLQSYKQSTHLFTSWSKPELLSVKEPLQKAKWMTL